MQRCAHPWICTYLHRFLPPTIIGFRLRCALLCYVCDLILWLWLYIPPDCVSLNHHNLLGWGCTEGNITDYCTAPDRP